MEKKVSSDMRSETLRPQPEDFEYDLKTALTSVVSVSTHIPDDAMTADVLGTERMGNGVVIREGIVLTIGYLVTEAQTVWISNGDMTIAGHVLGYDQATGFGLVQALGKLNLPPLRERITDPQLAALVDTALADNVDVQIAQERIAEARALAGVELARRPDQSRIQTEGADRLGVVRLGGGVALGGLRDGAGVGGHCRKPRSSRCGATGRSARSRTELASAPGGGGPARRRP